MTSDGVSVAKEKKTTKNITARKAAVVVQLLLQGP